MLFIELVLALFTVELEEFVFLYFNVELLFEDALLLVVFLLVFDLLELLLTNPNKVYSREKLLSIVWGYEYPGDVRTVDVHIRRLREKIESNPSEPKYVFTKWGVGYFFKE